LGSDVSGTYFSKIVELLKNRCQIRLTPISIRGYFTGFQPLPGSYSVIVEAISTVFSPRSFS